MLSSCAHTTNWKTGTLRRYARHIPSKFNDNSNTLSNKRQESAADEPFLDQIQAGMREEEAR